MRVTRQSVFRQPLDRILGRVSSVRVLRELAFHGGPLSASDLASRINVSKTAVGKTLTLLQESHVVEPLGEGRYVDYRLSDSHFLAESLKDLFQDEARRSSAVFDSLRELAEKVNADVEAVWVYGSVARGEDDVDSDFDVLVVVPTSRERSSVEEHLRDEMIEITESWNLTPSLVIVTSDEVNDGMLSDADFFRNLEKDAVVVYGRPPKQALNG